MRCRRIRDLLLVTAISWVSLQAQPQPTILSINSVVEKRISGGEQHLYRLALAVGQEARLTVEQKGIDVTVQVLDPAGKAVAEFDSEARPDGSEPVEIVAPQSGADWQLRIQPKYPKLASGSYEIRMQEIRDTTAADRSGFEAQLLIFRAAASVDAGDYDEAGRLATRSIEEADKAFGPEDARLCPLLDRLGLIQRRKGQYEKAEQSLKRLMAIAEKIDGRESQLAIRALRGLTDLYVSTGNYARAEPLVQEYLAVVEKLLGPGHPAMINALSSSAALHRHRQDLPRALSERERALAIADKTLDPLDYTVLASVGNLGDEYSLMGDFVHAEPLLARTLTLAENRYGPDHPIVATALQNLGATARETGQYDRAAALLQRALSIREKTLGNNHPDTASLLINLGNVYHDKRDFPNALAMHLRAFDILTAVAGPYHRLTLMALSNAGREYAAEGDQARALDFRTRYANAIDKDVALHLSIGSEREKLLYISALSSFVDRLVSFHVNGAPDDGRARDLAALVVLRHKGRVLDAVSGGMASLRGRLNTEDRALLDQLSETNSRLATLALGGPRKTPLDEYRSQLAALEESREKMESAISRRSAEYRAQSQAVSLEAVRAAIPADAALVEFASYRPYDPRALARDSAFGKPHYVAYILRREGDVRWADLGSRLAIDESVEAFRRALRDPGSRDVRTLARTLDSKILQPLRPLLGNAARLLISPDGSLNLIPFEALVDEQGRYLVQRVAVQYLTAGRDLLRLQVKRSNRAAPLVIADPFFGDPADTGPKLVSQAVRRSVIAGKDLSSLYFAPLPGTAQEAESIRSQFPDAVVLTGREATKAALRRVSAPSILHIATHGFFLEENRPAGDNEDPEENPLLRSGLALAGANLKGGQGGDGILTALEASTLDLWGTRIVTLSACETGVGEVRIGEGVYGLRRAFFLAGAETLVMSLWPVSDRFTRQIMTAYYAGLKKGLGRGDALRQAQLATLRNLDRAHPFYWAAFIQSGDWGRLDP